MSIKQTNNNIKTHFNNYAIDDEWGNLYNPSNPISYSFIERKKKVLLMLKEYGVKNKKVLDMGCGSGAIMEEIVKEGGEFNGIDFSENMIIALKNKYKDLIIKYPIKVEVGDCTKTHYENETFDYVIGMGLVEYFDNPDILIKETIRLLKKDGKVIFTIPNSKSFDYFMVSLLYPVRKLMKFIIKNKQKAIKRKVYAPREFDKLMKQYGFYVVNYSFYNIKPLGYPVSKFFPKFTNWISKHVEYKKHSIWKYFATGYIGVYRKLEY